MPPRRRPKGSTQGGQFAPTGRPAEPVLNSALTLTDSEPSTAANHPKAETREFFDELAYMAGVGPKVEVLAGERTHALADYAEKASARLAVIEQWPHHFAEENQEELAPFSEAASAACEHARSLSNDLFSMLDACVTEGGDKERHARLALRVHGVKLSQAKFKPPYPVQGIVKARRGPYPYNFNLWHGRYKSGLALAPISKPDRT